VAIASCLAATSPRAVCLGFCSAIVINDLIFEIYEFMKVKYCKIEGN
jgi:hypothetical protein